MTAQFVFSVMKQEMCLLCTPALCGAGGVGAQWFHVTPRRVVKGAGLTDLYVYHSRDLIQRSDWLPRVT